MKTGIALLGTGGAGAFSIGVLKALEELSIPPQMKMCIRDSIETVCRDLAEFSPEGERGIVLCNPPYGERMLDVQEAERLYRVMGQRFVPQKGWSYYICLLYTSAPLSGR